MHSYWCNLHANSPQRDKSKKQLQVADISKSTVTASGEVTMWSDVTAKNILLEKTADYFLKSSMR